MHRQRNIDNYSKRKKKKNSQKRGKIEFFVQAGALVIWNQKKNFPLIPVTLVRGWWVAVGGAGWLCSGYADVAYKNL